MSENGGGFTASERKWLEGKEKRGYTVMRTERSSIQADIRKAFVNKEISIITDSNKKVKSMAEAANIPLHTKHVERCKCGFRIRGDKHTAGIHHKDGMLMISDGNGGRNQNVGHSRGGSR